ncbi:PREDICTED: epididymal secretory protein E3-beta-like [Galeopterus variegatus]|uniref:Epididymal secretory protein E3-beta-like n=1 Tax=Galeopterus variegatus TaxID=482537 RepID=A0ABM0S1H5_GALVR|nr:PREDICTED: epididymal secretory protein E3-beta-like [Galeopterus variegatus]
MASSLKVCGMLLALLCLLCRLLVHSKNISWREFMKQHHLNPNREFNNYKCDALMREKGLENKNSNIFIYISWFKIKKICINNRWNDRYRNAYVWFRYALKVLKCYWENSKNSYRESRSYNYFEFHCNMDGYVDGIEDLKMVQPINS